MSGESRTKSSTVAIRLLVVIAAAVALSTLLGLWFAGSSYTPAATGLPDAGPVVGWGLPILQGFFYVSALATVGWLLYAAFLDSSTKKRVVSPTGRRALVWVSVSASLLVVSALLVSLLTLAQILGVDIVDALNPELIATYWWDVLVVRALAFSALIALIIAIGAAFTIRLTTATIWLVLALVAVALPSLTGHSAGLGDHSMAILNGVGHSVAATLWVGGLVSLAVVAWDRIRARAGSADDRVLVGASRFSAIAAACVVVLAGTGIGNAYTRLASFSDLWTSGYGRLTVVKAVLLTALICLGFVMRKKVLRRFVGAADQDSSEPGARRGILGAFAKLASIELVFMALATGFGIALASTPPTRLPINFPSTAEEILGFEFPPPPTFADVAIGLQLDTLFLVLGIAGLFFYFWGVIRLRKRGDSWPIGRTIAWIFGILVVVWATNSPVSAYASVSVGIHMIQHMTLTMMAPIGLVLGAPITLALRAVKPSPSGGRGPRELILSGVHSWPAKFFTNPAVVLFIYVIGIYGLYFTSLFGWLMANHIGHIFMTFHFILAGWLLTWVAIGIDPQPKPLPYWGRMILVISAVVMHAFFAVALMSATTGIGESWYSRVRPPWLLDPVNDTLVGGQIAWGIAEFPTLIVLVIIAVQWSRSDEREAKRRDRHVDQHGDQELDDYNAFLEALSKKDDRQK